MAALFCVAGGVLTKWTAPAFFYGTAVPLLWWRGRLRLLWCRQHLVSAALGAGLCFAWAGAVVDQVGWRPFYETVSREALVHLSPADHPRPYPWGETLAHPFVLLWASLPGSALALATLWPGFAGLWDERGRRRRERAPAVTAGAHGFAGLWDERGRRRHERAPAVTAGAHGFAGLWDERGRRLLQALHCWTWPNMLVWSLFPEHSPRHSFPLIPGLAGLAAMVWVACLTGRLRWRLPYLRPAALLVGLLALWLVVKVVFVQVVLPIRNPTREPRSKGEHLAALVPEGQTLYVFRVKDEGIMFYYGRPVRRVTKLDQLPSSGEPAYCILNAAEWQEWQQLPTVQVIWPLRDEQGKPIALVRVQPQGGAKAGNASAASRGSNS